MKHLIIFAHPRRESFNGAILHTYEQTLRQQGHEVEIHDLYESHFQPILSWQEYKHQIDGTYETVIEKEHDLIRWADVLTLIFPVWWASFPAVLKGYIDRVFSYSFAYELEGELPIPMLTGKKMATIFTSGTPASIYRESGMLDSMKQTFDAGIFEFCGLEVVGHLHFGDVIQASDDERQGKLAEVEEFSKRWGQ